MTTRRAAGPLLVILLSTVALAVLDASGQAFWQGLVDWIGNTLAAEHMIAEKDVDLMQIIDDPAEIVEAIFSFYENRGFRPTREERERMLNL